MKKLLHTLLLLLVVGAAHAQEGIDSLIAIDEVAVVGRRPMKQIGVQRTKFDSVALKEHIALSMADVLTYNSSVFVKSYGRATLSTVAFRKDGDGVQGIIKEMGVDLGLHQFQLCPVQGSLVLNLFGHQGVHPPCHFVKAAVQGFQLGNMSFHGYGREIPFTELLRLFGQSTDGACDAFGDPDGIKAHGHGQQHHACRYNNDHG